MTALTEGDLIAGRYRLESLIGEGGMASVWRAEDQTLRRSVAIKLLYLRGHRDPTVIVDQFLREARIAASVQHRNVIHTVDFGVVDDLPYMVMELLSGESLYDRMQREPRLRMEEVVHFASLTLRGLAAVHEAGIVHRDLKPQNIFLHRDTDTVYPKILDFGISRSLGGDHERPSAISTQDGMIVGTPDYMSPEQARGEKNIDKRADIYSMGAIIYEGITGRLPYEASTVGELIVKIVTTTPPKMIELRPDVPEVLSDCIAQAMAHDREERFIDAQVFRRALISTAEKAFAVDSERPRAAAATPMLAPVPATAVPLPLPPPPSAAAMLAAPPPAAPAAPLGGPAKNGWGDFEGLSQQAGRDSPPLLDLHSPSPPLAAASAPMAAPVAIGREPSSARIPLGPRPVEPIAPLVVPPSPVRSSHAQREPGRASGARAAPKAGHSAPEDSALLGNSFDGLGGGFSADALDLDYGQGPAAVAARSRASQKMPGAKSPVQAKITAANARSTARKPGAAVAPAGVPARRPAAAKRPSWLWLLPVSLVIGLLALLLSPGLFSAPAPDGAAAAALEARNPATAGSDCRMQYSRRRNVGSRPVALRDVGF